MKTETIALEPGQAVLIAPDGTVVPVPPGFLADMTGPTQAPEPAGDA